MRVKYIKLSIIIICSSLIISCKKKNNQVVINKSDFKESNYFKEERTINNKYEVKYKGNDRAFGELELNYSYNKFRSEELLPFSLIMVEKYKKYKYCTTVFNYFIEFYTEKQFQYDGTEKSLVNYLKNFEKLNEDQRNYLLYFIKLGAVNNDFGSINYLKLLNEEGIGTKRNTARADSLDKIIKSLPHSIKGNL